jgi:glycosyltransferase involved in cell wall biosynthesis
MDSQIFCEARRILPELRKEAVDVEEYRTACSPDDIVLLHLSIGSAVNDIFPALPCRKALLYHNITPPEYLEGVQQQIAHNLARGREQLKALAGVADVVMADSRFNADELERMGYGQAHVLPLVLDLGKLRARPDRAVLKKYRDGMSNILFVGRCVPNKRIEDLLSAFYYYRNFADTQARLIHAGSFAGTEQYHALLLTFGRDLELRDMELVGAIRQNELNALYQCADLFLCMSEHEGFCIPLIESMVHDVPVLAYAAGAVPETLDGAGVLFHEKRFDQIAEMMHRLVHDQPFRKAIIQGQRERLRRYEARDLPAELRAHLAPLMNQR